ANITPIVIIAGAATFIGREGGITDYEMAMLIQSSMFIAGIATLIQLYPVWKIGSGLPIVMGVSFTFVGGLTFIASTYGIGTMMGAVIIGGLFEGFLGLGYKYWKKLIPPIVPACVVTTIGFSLLPIGVHSFGGGYGAKDFANPSFLLVGFVTLFACLAFSIFAKGTLRPLNVLFGLVVGYVLAIFMGMVDFSAIDKTIAQSGYVSFPNFLPYDIIFNPATIISVIIVFLVSAAETIGDTSAVVHEGLKREIKDKEISGSLACDGFISSLAGMFACSPITSFSQNVGLINMTKVVNRFTIMTGAVILLLAGLFPPVGALLATLPQPVLGGCTIMMFGAIVVSGMSMIGKCGYTQRNMVIVALSISVGLGFTQVPEIFNSAPVLVKDIFSGNPVAGVFIISIILNLVLPKDMEVIQS
nr:purine permease [Moraxellaceae bacterium]